MLHIRVTSAIVAITFLSFSTETLCAVEKKAKPKQAARIVFIGDSITDGNTYPLLVRQALSEAGQAVPVCINAGVAGDTARGMRQRIKRDVLVHRPTLVVLSVGINDVLHKVKPVDYEADVTAIAAELKKNRVPMIILTTTILGPKHSEADKGLAEFNAILRRLARKYDYPVAEVNQVMQKARSRGENILESDQVHLNFKGYRLLTWAVLDALGHPKAAVPKELKLHLLPGVVREWRLRAISDNGAPLNEQSVLKLQPESGWKSYTLPEQKALAHWWIDQERKRGFAVSLEKQIGAGKSYQGIAFLEEKKARDVFFNTGAQLQTIWLNGKRIYKSEGWTGWHAGKERVAARFQAGRNVIVIETGSMFFLSVTPTNDW
jgi:lysophospholipase L1-like esterase